jgi:hypothetical protein
MTLVKMRNRSHLTNTIRDQKTINILNIYQVLMSATISKCEVCGLEFGTPGELDEHKRAKHQG